MMKKRNKKKEKMRRKRKEGNMHLSETHMKVIMEK
jgi:hypothetical protein